MAGYRALLGELAGSLEWHGVAIENGKTAATLLEANLDCGGFLRLHSVCGEVSFYAKSCDQRVCPKCGGRLSRRWAEALGGLVDGEGSAVFKRPRLVTFTVPNIEFLGSAMGDIGLAFKKMVRREGWKRSVLGGVRGTEATFNRKAENWHPHLHALVDVQVPGRLRRKKYPSDMQWAFDDPGWLWMYPVLEIKRVGDKWERGTMHPGLANRTGGCKNGRLDGAAVKRPVL